MKKALLVTTALTLAVSTATAQMPSVEQMVQQQGGAIAAPQPDAPAQLQPQPATAPQAVTPVAPVQQVPVQQAPVTASTPVQPETKIVLENVPADVRASLQNDFKDQLPFALTEDKMIAYINAAEKVEKINARWDIEIAGAASDQMAVENNNFAVEEINAALKNMQGLTMDEYTALTVLTAKDNSFARIVNIYRDAYRAQTGKESTVKEPAVTEVAPVTAPVAAPPPTAPVATRSATVTQTDPHAARIEALQKQIEQLTATLKAKREAAAQQAPAQADPLTAAQIEALSANAKKIDDKLNAIDQRANEVEQKIKKN